MSDAIRQVEAVLRNVLADYGELYQLRRENKFLSDTNENLESELNTLLEQLAIPSIRNPIFAVADALICGRRYHFPSVAVVLFPIFLWMVADLTKRKKPINADVYSVPHK